MLYAACITFSVVLLGADLALLCGGEGRRLQLCQDTVRWHVEECDVLSLVGLDTLLLNPAVGQHMCV